MVKILKKVMLVNEYKDGTTFWRVPCDCNDPDHDVHLWFEVDDDGIASLRITRQLGYYKNSWYDDAPVYDRFLHWCDRMWDRFKAANKILFKGYLTMDGDVILTKEGIEGLQYALIEGNKVMIKAEDAFHAKRKAEAESKKDA